MHKGLNQVKYAKIMITHIRFIALTLARLQMVFLKEFFKKVEKLCINPPQDRINKKSDLSICIRSSGVY